MHAEHSSSRRLSVGAVAVILLSVIPGPGSEAQAPPAPKPSSETVELLFV